MSNKTYVDPFDYTTVYPILGTIVSVAILLNVISCMIMIKNKDLRKNRQFFVYITISLTEIISDALYIVILFWRRENAEFFCLFIFLFFCLGRENIQLQLLCLCVERCFALNVSLNDIFRKMVTVKGRLTAFVSCVVISSLIMAPIVSIYAHKDSYACGPATLFENNSRLVLRYIRTVLSLQIVFMLGVYLYVTKKVQTLTAPNLNSTDVSQVGSVQSKAENKMETVLTGSSRDTKENSKTCVTQTTSATTSNAETVQKTDKESPKQSIHPHLYNNSKRQGGKWKPRTLNMLRSVILTTVFPSIPMLGLQIVDYINPRFMNTTHDVIISLCNVLHAVVFPLIFIMTVKNITCMCCKKRRNIDTSN